jgi:hypothetical protein
VAAIALNAQRLDGPVEVARCEPGTVALLVRDINRVSPRLLRDRIDPPPEVLDCLTRNNVAHPPIDPCHRYLPPRT